MRAEVDAALDALAAEVDDLGDFLRPHRMPRGANRRACPART